MKTTLVGELTQEQKCKHVISYGDRLSGNKKAKCLKCDHTPSLAMSKMFDNIKIYRKKIVKVRKTHQCIMCGNKIPVKESADNTTFSYDGRLVSVYYHLKCLENGKA